MAYPNVTKPAYPDVPMAPGVPAVPRQQGVTFGTVALATADAASIVALFLGAQWGLFTQGNQPAFGGASGLISAALTGNAQSIGELEYRLDYRIATAPQEQGAFVSYNKVSSPFNGRVSYIISGTVAQRAVFIQMIEAAIAGLTLYNLVMPEFTYPNCNITHYDLRRTAQRGVSMFVVDVWVEQVRVTGTAAYSNTAQPSGADPVNVGTVQPQTPTAQQSAATGTLN